MISQVTRKRWEEIIGGVELRSDLTQLEYDFIGSIQIHCAIGKTISRKQSSCLYKIAEKYGL